MKSDELIRSLAAQMTPVQRLASVNRRSLLWSAFALACVWINAHALGTRTDLSDKLQQASFVCESVALLSLFSLSAWSAFQFSVPGNEGRGWLRTLPLLGLLVWVVMIMARSAFETSPNAASAWFATSGLACVGRMAALALIPMLSLFSLLRKAAPLACGWTGLFALLAANALAMLGTQMLCAKDDPPHVLLWHVAPVLIAAIIGVGLGKLFLSRPNRRTQRA